VCTQLCLFCSSPFVTFFDLGDMFMRKKPAESAAPAETSAPPEISAPK
jgi:hypothetical protein